ncbi:MAG: amidohydrolase family protein, partial [Proteobacteria bacterium]|nr:amidohydrolase family protein [Pseudomonadota bacterium]
RDLQTGGDRWLAFPVERDEQDGSYSRDTLPRYDFTPDGKSLIASIGGRPHRIDVATGHAERLPFRVTATIGIGPYLPRQQGVESGPVRARIIQEPRLSPDGTRVAFSALTRLYVMDLSTDGLRHVETGGMSAYQPAWSPDGRWLAFVTWDALGGGHVFRVRPDGRQLLRVSDAAAHYSDPVWSADGKSLFALRSSRYDRLRRIEEVSPVRLSDLVRFSLGSEHMDIVAALEVGAQRPYFTDDPERVYFTSPEGVASIAVDGSDRRVRFRIEGAYPWHHRHERPVPVEQAVLSPDRRWALTRSGDQLHLLRVPPNGGVDTAVDLTAAPLTPYARVSEFGADYFGWADDGSAVHWALGATFHRRSFDGKGGLGDVRANEAVVEIPRDVPEGSLLLRGATAIAMRGDEVIEDADVLIRGNEIAAVGRRGEVDIPPEADVRDVGGRYIVPGFVDTHAHWYEVRRDVLDLQGWSLLINLAYGVTSGLDVQAMDQDMFAYQDLIDAGLMIGPRAWSVGRGMFSDNEIEDREDVRQMLRRYRDYYRTRNVKAYGTGNRRVRQWVVEESAKLGMLPTTEGMADTRLDLTHAMDGFAGNEHYLPSFPMYRDIVELFASTRISYTPTLLISSGGPAAEDVMFTSQAWHDDPKLRRFMPRSVIDAKASPRQWLRDDQHIYRQLARDAHRIRRAGGRVGIGSHAQLQGVAYHWEMQLFAAGGWTPREILEAATVTGSDIIGRADAIGSLDAGKYADLLVLAGNPLEDIANTQSIEFVMKNGRLYDADTLDEVWPRRRPLPALWVGSDLPVPNHAGDE